MAKEAHKRWVPWVCAYTGARIAEICQLRTEDIKQIDGIWCIAFAAEAGSLKNINSERVVPVHAALEDEGFLKFAKLIRKGPLFADLGPDRFGSRGGTGTKILSRWIYVDIESYQDDALNWNTPHDPYTGLPFLDDFMPPALRIAAAMEQVGMFTVQGLQAVSDIWGSLEYKEKEDHHDGNKLTERLLHRLQAEGLMLKSVQEDDFATLYRTWQIPMYNLDFSLIPMSLEELEAAQEREYWSMVGDP